MAADQRRIPGPAGLLKAGGLDPLLLKKQAPGERRRLPPPVLTPAQAAKEEASRQAAIDQAAQAAQGQPPAPPADPAAMAKAADAELSYGLRGTLYVSSSGWGLLQVPNDLGKGAFAALREPGAVLPGGPEGRYNAHVSVFRKEELDRIGGPEKLKERGHEFGFTLGPVRAVKPLGWDGVSKCWYIEVHSPELMQLRRSYGLPALPRKGDKELKLHITFAIKPTAARGEKSAAENPWGVVQDVFDNFAEYLESLLPKKAGRPAARFEERVTHSDPFCPHCGEEMPERHYVPDQKSAGAPSLYRHRGDCYDKGPFEIVWPKRAAAEDDERRPAPLAPWIPGVGAAAAGAGALAYGLGSDAQFDGLRNAVRNYGMPPGPGETAATRYQSLMSHGAGLTPFGVPAGEISAFARRQPWLVEDVLGINGFTSRLVGEHQQDLAHYDQFRKGPVSAYWHQLLAKGSGVPVSPETLAALPPDAPKPRDYADLLRDRFLTAFRNYERDRGTGSSWLMPHEIDTDYMSHDEQNALLRRFDAELPPALQAERQRVETAGWGEGFKQNVANYMPALSAATTARDVLKSVGTTAGGAAVGGIAGHYLHDLLADDENADRDRTAATLAGAAAGGLLGAVAGPREGWQAIGSAIGSGARGVKGLLSRIKGAEREFVPGEDCPQCDASLERSTDGYCNSCGVSWPKCPACDSTDTRRVRGVGYTTECGACGHRFTDPHVNTRYGEKRAADGVFKERAESAAANVTDPSELSEAQRESLNYRQGHARIHGLKITIQAAKGQKRKPDWSPLLAHYGHVLGVPAKSRDGEHVDVFVGPDPDAEVAFVADLVTPADGVFDEVKVLLGFPSRAEAKRVYEETYPAKFRGPLSAVTVPQLKEWLHHGNAAKPFRPQIARLKAASEDAPEGVLILSGPDGSVRFVGPEPSPLDRLPEVRR